MSDKTNKTESKEAKNIKIEWRGGLQLQIKDITNNDSGEEYIYEVNCAGNDYTLIIKYNHDRDKWQGLVIKDERKHSLSFYSIRPQAYSNALSFIVISNGGIIKDNNLGGIGN